MFTSYITDVMEDSQKLPGSILKKKVL